MAATIRQMVLETAKSAWQDGLKHE